MRPPQFIYSVDTAPLFKALGDVLRLDILRVLCQGSYGVQELTEIFETTQSGMSHHLKVLASAHLVTTRREGNSIFYRCATLNLDDALFDLKSSIISNVKKVTLEPRRRDLLNQIHQRRSEVSQLFFAQNAEAFQEKSELIADFTVYGPSVKEILLQSPLPSQKDALEIGPGNGEFLPELSTRFDNVVALDNSSAMLTQAQNFAALKSLNNVHWLCTEVNALQDYVSHFDCAIINMVLHHTPSPQHIFEVVSRALKTDGVLLICDLCLHSQEWVKEHCGDLWMGFDPNELGQWAKQTKLSEEQSSYIALRNGFQIQIKQFSKH